MGPKKRAAHDGLAVHHDGLALRVQGGPTTLLTRTNLAVEVGAPMPRRRLLSLLLRERRRLPRLAPASLARKGVLIVVGPRLVVHGHLSVVRMPRLHLEVVVVAGRISFGDPAATCDGGRLHDSWWRALLVWVSLPDQRAWPDRRGRTIWHEVRITACFHVPRPRVAPRGRE